MNENFYSQPNDSNIKWCEEIITGEGEDYTTGCLLDYYYVKNHFRLIAVDLSRRKEQMLIQKQLNKYNLLDN